MQRIIDFIRFLSNSTNAHGLHSPFMYHLATRCFYDKKKYPDYERIKTYHKQLKKDKRPIQVQDLGAGSKKLSPDIRRIKDIAKVAGSHKADMKLLYRLSKYFEPQNVLELGTSLGKSAFSLALGNPKASVITVEGDPNVWKVANAYFKKFKQQNIQSLLSDFDTYLDELNQTNTRFDMILLDGNHRLAPTLRYFEKLQKHIHNDTVVIVDDIYWSAEMKQAWQQLTQHPAVRQSVDTYRFGMLFFRKEQFKQKFVIRL